MLEPHIQHPHSLKEDPQYIVKDTFELVICWGSGVLAVCHHAQLDSFPNRKLQLGYSVDNVVQTFRAQFSHL